MIGLIKKDIYNLKSVFAIFIIFLALGFLSALGVLSGNSIPAVSFFIAMLFFCLAITNPFNFSAFDEQCGWDMFGNTFPVSRSKVVVSRYISILLTVLVLIVTTSFISSIALITGNGKSNLFLLIAVMANLSLFLSALYTPIIYKFGTKKGMMIFTIIIMLLTFSATFAILTAISPEAEELIISSESETGIELMTSDGTEAVNFLQSAAMYVIGAVVTLFNAICYVISMLISIAIYKKKEF